MTPEEENHGITDECFTGDCHHTRPAALVPPAPEVEPVALHPATAHLVERFAAALVSKLAKAEQKYGYSIGWMDNGWLDECREKLVEHISKGDPRDVAAYCAFLWHHGEKTALPPTNDGLRKAAEELLRVLNEGGNKAKAMQALDAELDKKS